MTEIRSLFKLHQGMKIPHMLVDCCCHPRQKISVFILVPVLLIIQTLIIRPWGNFPLNDDWRYSLVTMRWVETGSFSLFVPMSPSLVLQALWGKWFIDIFGFSHALLRFTNVLICIGWLGLLYWTLTLLKVKRMVRVILLILVITNPLVTYVTFSFMTDLPGLFISWLGILLWFWHLHILDKEGLNNKAFCVALAGSFFMGLSFWVRQLSVLVYPACFLARWGMESLSARRVFPGKKMLPYIFPSLIFALTIACYFWWARTTHNLSSEFTEKLTLISMERCGDILLQGIIWFFYATAFLFPILVLFCDAKEVFQQLKRKGVLGLILSLLLLSTAIYLRSNNDYDLKANVHAHFPFLGNILNPYGVGPITLTDVYIEHGPRHPRFQPIAWICLELGFIFSIVYWVKIVAEFMTLIKKRIPSIQSEACLFAVFLVCVTYFTNSVLFGQAIFDRYTLPILPGLLVFIGVLLSNTKLSSRRIAFVFLPLAFMYGLYGVGGVHDYFRWNEARWQLYQRALDKGINPLEVDGGHELNAWVAYRSGVEADTACSNIWFCEKRPYAISMHTEKATLLDEAKVPSILGEFPSLFLIKRVL